MLKDLEATQTKLLRNPRDIANVFKPYYGAYEHLRLTTDEVNVTKTIKVL